MLPERRPSDPDLPFATDLYALPRLMALSSFRRLFQVPAVRVMAAPALAVRRAVQKRRVANGRKGLDQLRNVLAADPVIRLAEFEGVFSLDARSHLFERIVLDGQYEPDLAAVCVAHLDPARDAIDVGTNVGFFTVLMARHLPERRVLAVEPTPAALAQLALNLRRNNVSDNVVTFEGAVANRPGRRQLSVIDGREEYASLGPLVHAATAGAAGHSIEVAVATIDDLVREHGLAPGFIKIDVEGAELSVLEGALETLRTHRPIILSELSPRLLAAQGATAERVLDLLRGLGYVLSDPTTPGGPVGKRTYGDLLAIPA